MENILTEEESLLGKHLLTKLMEFKILDKKSKEFIIIQW